MKGLTLAISGLASTSLLLLLLTVPAHAAATPMTVTFHDTTVSFPVTPITCPSGATGLPGGMLTITYNGVMHTTSDTAGGIHFTMTITGSFVLVATSGVTFTGHINVWSGGTEHFASNGASEIGFTASAHGTGTDGSTIDFHIVAHITINANGPPPTVMFMKVTC